MHSRELVCALCKRRVVLHRDWKLGALTMEPGLPVDSIQRLDLLRSTVLLVVRVQMRLPYVGGDALASKRLNVVVNVGQEDIQTTQGVLCSARGSVSTFARIEGFLKRTEMEKEVSTLLVRYLAIRVIGILASLKVNNEALILRARLVVLQRVEQPFSTNHVGESTLSRRMELLLQHTLHVGCETFIEPEVGRVGVSGGKVVTRLRTQIH